MATKHAAPDSRLRAANAASAGCGCSPRARSTSAASAAASRRSRPKLSRSSVGPRRSQWCGAGGRFFWPRSKRRTARSGHLRGAIFLVCGVWRSLRPCSYPSPPRRRRAPTGRFIAPIRRALLERAERALLERPDDDDLARRLVKLAGRDGRARLRERFRARAERAAAEGGHAAYAPLAAYAHLLHALGDAKAACAAFDQVAAGRRRNPCPAIAGRAARPRRRRRRRRRRWPRTTTR